MRTYLIVSKDINDEDFNEWMCDDCKHLAPEGTETICISVADVCKHCGKEDGEEEAQ